MALRKVQEFKNSKGDVAVIYRDSVWQEYRVRFSLAGIGYMPESDYHTNELSDALETAQHTLRLK